MYDIIGDVHGQARELRSLLEKLEYQADGNLYRHDTRKVIFLGDFIDRGDRNLEVCDIVKEMASHGHAYAIMGNHEFNAIGFYEEKPGAPAQFYRDRSNKNTYQHYKFLREVFDSGDTWSQRYQEYIDFFWSLPLFIELDELNIVHAAWNQSIINSLKPYLDEKNCLTRGSLPAAFDEGHELNELIECTLKGPEASLPDGLSFNDHDGNVRRNVRIKWWEKGPYRLATHAIGANLPMSLKNITIPADAFSGYEVSSDKLTFFGHYWFSGQPELIDEKAACLDFSVSKPGGQLAAYRWGGEDKVRLDNFVCVSRMGE